jgi:hypothetical protein
VKEAWLVIFEETGKLHLTEDEFKAWKEALVGINGFTKEEIDQEYKSDYTKYWKITLVSSLSS